MKSFIPMIDALEMSFFFFFWSFHLSWKRCPAKRRRDELEQKDKSIPRNGKQIFIFNEFECFCRNCARFRTKKLIEEYPHDVESNLASELIHFHMYVKQNYFDKRQISHSDLHQLIFRDRIQLAFPNVEVILHMFLCLLITNCSGERTFSQLKRIKNELKTTTTKDRLSGLSILCIEKDKLRSL